ncbi:rod shape-determining protein RodA [Marinicella sp. W31]|uniref:rod shape-determining protein RodA n=1 Tax=Marinicella sp. W31 TaxID=3023713 RepID=UPI003757AF08
MNNQWQFRIDPWLCSLLLAVIAYGLIVLYSAGGEVLVKKQAVRLTIGFVAFLIIAQIKPERFELFTPYVFVFSLLLLFAVFVFGSESKGAKRWLQLGIRFQPSELAKISIPLMLAWLLRFRSLPPDLKTLGLALVFILVPVSLVYKQPDLGTSILILISGAFVIFLAGLSWKIITAGVIGAIASTPILWYFMHDYQKSRVLQFFNPNDDPLNSGWNIIQSKIAIGSGGMFGKGWLSGTQTQLDFLPEHSTDFILSVLAEEFGFVGVLILFALYLMIIVRCFIIAQNAKNTYNRLICGALTMTFFVYVFINAGMISGMLPVVGIPLPLISYGGTSALTLMASFGIIMSVHTHKKLIQQ